MLSDANRIILGDHPQVAPVTPVRPVGRDGATEAFLPMVAHGSCNPTATVASTRTQMEHALRGPAQALGGLRDSPEFPGAEAVVFFGIKNACHEYVYHL